MTDHDQTRPLAAAPDDRQGQPNAEIPTTVAEWRTALAASPVIAFDALYPTDALQRDTQQTAESILSGAWRDMHFPPMDLRPPVAWENLSSVDRIREFRLHSWHALGPVLAIHDQTAGEHYLDFAVALALDWVTFHDAQRESSPFAWYPMAAGARAHRLAYIVDRVIRRERIADEELNILLQSMNRHIAALGDDTTFPAHSNQGVFIAASQASVARRFQALAGMTAVSHQAHTRLLGLLEAQFTAEGVHREHSPEYHLRTLRTFEALVQNGLLTEESALARLQLAAEAFAWFVLPHGILATFGDTSHMEGPGIPQASPAGTLEAQERSHHHTAVREFKESGYVVIRTSADDVLASSYLAQTCAFHSRVHKHADDLSVIWYDRGHEILIDPGKYGYFGQTEADSDLAREGFWYSDPNRIYVESTRAHNTVEIDGRSYDRREPEPYGSAVRHASTADGIAFAEAEVTHFSSLKHARVLVLHPGNWLLIFDRLEDHANEPHTFTQRLHFAPELALLPSDAEPRFAVPGNDTPLRVVSLLAAPPHTLVSGQRTPDLLGWVSRREGEMTPCWTAATTLASVPGATFATLLTFSDGPVATASPHWTASKVNADGQRAFLRWQQEERVHTVQIERPAGEKLGVAYRAVQARR